MSELDRIRQEQRAAAVNYLAGGDRGAALGMADWFTEELLFLREVRDDL